MSAEIDFGVVEFITVGTIGPAGERVFHLQFGRTVSDMYTLVFEKEQARALADSIRTMLDEIEEKFDKTTPPADKSKFDMLLREPLLPFFRISQMGLGYNVDDDQIVLIINELLLSDDPDEPRTLRMSASREKMWMLAEYTDEVVAGGRPICGNCGHPIDPDGHFCPKSNGHGRKVAWA